MAVVNKGVVIPAGIYLHAARLECGFIAVWSEPPGRPVPVGQRAGNVADYIAAITARADLPSLRIEDHGEGAFQIA